MDLCLWRLGVFYALSQNIWGAWVVLEVELLLLLYYFICANLLMLRSIHRIQYTSFISEQFLNYALHLFFQLICIALHPYYLLLFIA